MNESTEPFVGIIMGSQSDLSTMQHAVGLLGQLDVLHDRRAVSLIMSVSICR